MRAGSTLLVTRTDSMGDVASHVADNGQIAFAPEVVAVSAVRYTVRRGDTLSGIASRHGVSSATIVRANKLKSSNVRIGQTLVIPGGKTTAAKSGSKARAKKASSSSRKSSARKKKR
nr:LysM [uncultured Comamonas sp.]